MGWRGDRWPGVQQVADALHGAGRLLHIAPDLAQGTGGAGGHDSEEGELNQRPPAHLAAQSGVDAKPEHGDDATEHQGDHHRHHACAGTPPFQ